MARTIKQEEHMAKRNEILDATQRLILSKGYVRMTIQDILGDLGISSGAFYHYFDSKPTLLEAYIARIKEETERPLLPIIRDSRLSAIAKLQGFFDTLDRLRIAHKQDVVELGRVWYTDDNAIVRQKVDEAILKQRAPLLNEIVRQGIEEGVFTVSHPEQAGEVILSLLQGMGNSHAKLFLALDQARDAMSDVNERYVEEIVAIHAAYMEALERMLGAPANSLVRTDADTVMKVWVTALQDNEST